MQKHLHLPSSLSPLPDLFFSSPLNPHLCLCAVTSLLGCGEHYTCCNTIRQDVLSEVKVSFDLIPIMLSSAATFIWRECLETSVFCICTDSAFQLSRGSQNVPERDARVTLVVSDPCHSDDSPQMFHYLYLMKSLSDVFLLTDVLPFCY